MRRSLLRLLILLLSGCGLLGEAPFAGGDSLISQARLLELCEESCEVQAHGEMCTPEPYLGWCIENCHTIDGLIPEHCRAEAAETFTCWIENDWTCLDGSEVGWQPQLLEEGVCSQIEDRYWLCA